MNKIDGHPNTFGTPRYHSYLITSLSTKTLVNPLFLTVLFFFTFLPSSTISDQCMDPDQQVYTNSDGSKSSTRDMLTNAGLYCDVALSWNVSNTTVFNPSPHTTALGLYKTLLAKVTNDSLEGDRKAGINKDCLALAYKAVCAFTIPYCKENAEVTLTRLTQKPAVCKYYCDLMKYRCATPLAYDFINQICVVNRVTDCAFAERLGTKIWGILLSVWAVGYFGLLK